MSSFPRGTFASGFIHPDMSIFCPVIPSVQAVIYMPLLQSAAPVDWHFNLYLSEIKIASITAGDEKRKD